jgi:hypothetical protein
MILLDVDLPQKLNSHNSLFLSLPSVELELDSI